MDDLHREHTRCADGEHSHVEHAYSLSQELACHLPYATFSVAFGFVVLSLVYFVSLGFTASTQVVRGGYHVLFHAFHYLHLVFATVGTFVALARFRQSTVIKSIAISVASSMFFCTLSDIALPSLVAYFLGIAIDVHICFFSIPDLVNVAPFIVMGLITGFAISRHHKPSLTMVSLSSHFIHILISSLAATFYIASYGFNEWHVCMGLLYFLLVIAVVVPCTVSDVVIPLYCSNKQSKTT